MNVYRALVWVEEIRPLTIAEKYQHLGKNHDPNQEVAATFMGKDVRALAASNPAALCARVSAAAHAIPLSYTTAPIIHTTQQP